MNLNDYIDHKYLTNKFPVTFKDPIELKDFLMDFQKEKQDREEERRKNIEKNRELERKYKRIRK